MQIARTISNHWQYLQHSLNCIPKYHIMDSQSQSQTQNPAKNPNPNRITVPESDPTTTTTTTRLNLNVARRKQKRVMDNFRAAVMEIACTDPVTPLTVSRKMLIEKRITDFFPDFRTPDHPPYAAMIHRAVEELNEEGGSSEESISKFITKEYNDLPWAHSTLLRHHLGKLCESGDIDQTSDKNYTRTALISHPDLSPLPSTKKKQSKRKRRRDKEQSRGRRKRGKTDKIEEKNEPEEEQMEVIPEVKEVQGEDEVIREQNQVEEHENEMIEFKVIRQENRLNDSKEKEQESGVSEGQNQLEEQESGGIKINRLLERKSEMNERNSSSDKQQKELFGEINLLKNQQDKQEKVGVEYQIQPEGQVDELTRENLLSGDHGQCDVGDELPAELSSPQRPPGYDLTTVEELSKSQVEQKENTELPNRKSPSDLELCVEQNFVVSKPTTKTTSIEITSHSQPLEPETDTEGPPRLSCLQKPPKPQPNSTTSLDLLAVSHPFERDIPNGKPNIKKMISSDNPPTKSQQIQELQQESPNAEWSLGLCRLQKQSESHPETTVVLPLSTTTSSNIITVSHLLEHGQQPEILMLMGSKELCGQQKPPEHSQPEPLNSEKPSEVELVAMEELGELSYTLHQMRAEHRQLRRQSQIQRARQFCHRKWRKSEPKEITAQNVSMNSGDIEPELRLELSDAEKSKEIEPIIMEQLYEEQQDQEKFRGQRKTSESHPEKTSESLDLPTKFERSTDHQSSQTERMQRQRKRWSLKNPKYKPVVIDSMEMSPSSQNQHQEQKEVQNCELPQEADQTAVEKSAQSIDSMEMSPSSQNQHQEQKEVQNCELPQEADQTAVEKSAQSTEQQEKLDGQCSINMHCASKQLDLEQQLELSSSDGGHEHQSQQQKKPKHMQLRFCPLKSGPVMDISAAESLPSEDQHERRGRVRPLNPKPHTDTTVGAFLSLYCQNETDLRRPMENPSGDAELLDICGLHGEKQQAHTPERSLGIELMEELSTQDQPLSQAQDEPQCRKLRSRPPKVEKQQPEGQRRGRPPIPKCDTHTTVGAFLSINDHAEVELQQDVEDSSGDVELLAICVLQGEKRVHSPQRSSRIKLMEELSIQDQPLIEARDEPPRRILRSWPPKVEKRQPEGRGRGRPLKPKPDTDTTVGAFLSTNHHAEAELQQPVEDPSGKAEFLAICVLQGENRRVHSSQTSLQIELMEELSTEDQPLIQAQDEPPRRKLRSRPPKVEKHQSQGPGQGRPPKPKPDSDTVGAFLSSNYHNETKLLKPMKNPSGDVESLESCSSQEQKQPVQSPEGYSGDIVREELSSQEKPQCSKLRSWAPKVEKQQPEHRGRGRPPKQKPDEARTVRESSPVDQHNEHDQQPGKNPFEEGEFFDISILPQPRLAELQIPERSSGIKPMEELSIREIQREQAEQKPQCRKCRKLQSRASNFEQLAERRGRGRRPIPEVDTTTTIEVLPSKNEHSARENLRKEEKEKHRGRPPKTKLGDGTPIKNLLASEKQQDPPKFRGRGRPRKME